MTNTEDYGSREEYVSEDDKWQHDKCVCHKCGRHDVVTNGVIFDCTHCEWWMPVSESKRDEVPQRHPSVDGGE